ncbi:MAG: hypothetical protein E5V25_02865 [Mesorhizobium sp.]|nr:MAG: hypothetical protein EOS48_04150 [Mesorhizobium sp.]TIS35510.1 MAG: hypothetical protein E5W95_25540 [Mesorhizobium sp.]TIX74235.1 MAG: hypothetical protein E5V25_02865 [Mesorhizobium sp.]
MAVVALVMIVLESQWLVRVRRLTTASMRRAVCRSGANAWPIGLVPRPGDKLSTSRRNLRPSRPVLQRGSYENWSFDLSARFLNIIGAATSAGAYSPGQEQAPAAFRRHGLAEALASRGRTIRDHGDVASFRWRPDPSQPQAMNLEAVRHACDVVASHVATAIAAQEDVLVLGGDCTVELGTVAGANAAGARIAFALKQLTALPQWRGLTITEINPAHAPDESAAFARLNEVLADALG